MEALTSLHEAPPPCLDADLGQSIVKSEFMVAAFYAAEEAAFAFRAHEPGVRVQQDDCGPPVRTSEFSRQEGGLAG